MFEYKSNDIKFILDSIYETELEAFLFFWTTV